MCWVTLAISPNFLCTVHAMGLLSILASNILCAGTQQQMLSIFGMNEVCMISCLTPFFEC